MMEAKLAGEGLSSTRVQNMMANGKMVIATELVDRLGQTAQSTLVNGIMVELTETVGCDTLMEMSTAVSGSTAVHMAMVSTVIRATRHGTKGNSNLTCVMAMAQSSGKTVRTTQAHLDTAQSMALVRIRGPMGLSMLAGGITMNWLV
jgi:hypothetical protein